MTSIEEPKIDPKEIELVKQSYERCKSASDFFMDFYKFFLSQDPRIAGYFKKTDFSKQIIVLRSSIDYLIMYGSGSRIASTKVDDLGIKHNRDHLNIPTDLYRIWLDALLVTIKKHDKEYDEHLRILWINTLTSGIEKIKSMY